jgi:hypothetical protein
MTNMLSDIITYVRRIVKTPSNAVITDALIVDYINRFWLMDVSARIQLFDLKTTYQFQTTPGVDQYNMPLYSTQSQVPSTVEFQVNLLTDPFPDGTAVYNEDILASIKLSDPSVTLKPGTISFWLDRNLGNETLYQDDGFGVMTNVNGGPFTISSGTIDYTTGDLELNFTAIPGTGIPAVASFTYLSVLGNEPVAMFPVYQGFMGPAYVNGIEMPFYTQRSQFFNLWPSYNQTLVQAGIGNGSTGPYDLQLPFLPTTTSSTSSCILRGHVDLTGIIATGANIDPPLDTTLQGTVLTQIPTTSIYPQVYFTSTASDGSNIVISDSGVFISSAENYGLLISPGKAPYGTVRLVLPGGPPQPAFYNQTHNTINYQTGLATNVVFPEIIPNGVPIMGQCVFYQTGIPRACLFYNNTLTLRAPPNTQYLIQLDAYLTPAAFFNTSAAIPFGYMAEYIARGAARKILSDVGDWEQFAAYEPLFKEQENLVHIRSQRIWTSTRTQTIYSQDGFPNTFNNSSLGI